VVYILKSCCANSYVFFQTGFVILCSSAGNSLKNDVPSAVSAGVSKGFC